MPPQTTALDRLDAAPGTARTGMLVFLVFFIMFDFLSFLKKTLKYHILCLRMMYSCEISHTHAVSLNLGGTQWRRVRVCQANELDFLSQEVQASDTQER